MMTGVLHDRHQTPHGNVSVVCPRFEFDRGFVDLVWWCDEDICSKRLGLCTNGRRVIQCVVEQTRKCPHTALCLCCVGFFAHVVPLFAPRSKITSAAATP